jgi:hypothetical protein
MSGDTLLAYTIFHMFRFMRRDITGAHCRANVSRLYLKFSIMVDFLFCLLALSLYYPRIVTGEPLPIQSRSPQPPTPQPEKAPQPAKLEVFLRPLYYVKPGTEEQAGCDKYLDVLQKAYVEAITIGNGQSQCLT